jgi:hypothetical protein
MRTNTPLQALVILNDPLVVESARVFAERLMQQSSTPEEKIITAFRSIVCRKPKDEELTMLLKYYNEEVATYTASPEDAKKFINAGEYPSAGIRDVVSLAALMQVVHTIYNMDESITKV